MRYEARQSGESRPDAMRSVTTPALNGSVGLELGVGPGGGALRGWGLAGAVRDVRDEVGRQPRRY